MAMSAFCNLYALENAIMFNDAYDRNVIHFDSVVANFRYARDTHRSFDEPRPLSLSSRNQVYNNTGMNILSMLGFEKITAPFPAVEMNLFRNNRALGELNAQLFDRFV